MSQSNCNETCLIKLFKSDPIFKKSEYRDNLLSLNFVTCAVCIVTPVKRLEMSDSKLVVLCMANNNNFTSISVRLFPMILCSSFLYSKIQYFYKSIYYVQIIIKSDNCHTFLFFNIIFKRTA